MYNNLEALTNLIYSPDFKRENLTDKQVEYFDKLDVADNLLREEISFKRAKEKFVAKYSSIQMSHITAAKYLREAQILFSSKSRYLKEYYKDILLERALTKLDWCYKENRISDFNKTLKNIIVLFGFDRSDSSIIDPELLKQHSYNIIFNLNGEKSSYNLDFSKMQEMSIAQRMTIVNTIEAEAIDFEMSDVIKDKNEG